jgi:23S rRNA (uridine2552-2'-O)-methyltransferase
MIKEPEQIPAEPGFFFARIPVMPYKETAMTVKDRSRLSDSWSRAAKKSGYPARSVFKLSEFDQKYHLFRPGMRILDLGCAPGSWTLYAAERTGPSGQVVGIDLNEPGCALPAQARTVRLDLLNNGDGIGGNGFEEIIFLLGGRAQAVLSDLAPRTTGRKEVDQMRSLELVQCAWTWAGRILAEGGFFLFKIFQSQEGEELIGSLADRFGRIIRLKPLATRKNSQEIFVLARDFRYLKSGR